MENNVPVVKPLQKKHKQLYMFKVGTKKIVLDLTTAQIALEKFRKETPIKIIGPVCMVHESICKAKDCIYRCKVMDDVNNIEWNVITNYYKIKQTEKRHKI